MTKIEQAEQWLTGKAPILWRNGDVLSMDDMRRLATFPQMGMAKLFDAGEKPYNFAISGVECEDCGHAFTVHGLSKSRVINAVRQVAADARDRRRARYGRIEFLCTPCKFDRKRKEAVERGSRDADDRNTIALRTEWYITRYLNPDHAWLPDLPKKEWFSEINVSGHLVNLDAVASAIKGLPYRDFLTTPYWKAVAQHVKYKAGFRCQMCNAGGSLHVHHRFYGTHGYEHQNLKDLICLCAECHAKHHDIEE